MTVCNICGEPASKRFTRFNGEISKTVYYCKSHDPNSKPVGISSEQMKEWLKTDAISSERLG